MRAIHINAVDHTVDEITVPDTDQLAELQRLVGGYIEVAHRFPNGDILYVDEEGLFKDPTHFFAVSGAHQPFAGNGVILGPEDSEGEETPAQTPVARIRHLVRWLTKTGG